jgi:hypothetical protein
MRIIGHLRSTSDIKNSIKHMIYPLPFSHRTKSTITFLFHSELRRTSWQRNYDRRRRQSIARMRSKSVIKSGWDCPFDLIKHQAIKPIGLVSTALLLISDETSAVLRLSVVFFSILRKFRGHYFSWIMAASFEILSNSFLTRRNTTWRCMICGTTSNFTGKLVTRRETGWKDEWTNFIVGVD